MASDESHYTILYTCALALSIPCNASSPDSGATIPIDKLCPQCAPTQHMFYTIFDQEHHDDVQAAKASSLALSRSPRAISEKSSAASSMLSVPEHDKSPASSSSSVSSRSKSSTRSKVSTGVSKLRQLVRGSSCKPANVEKPYKEGTEAPHMASWVERVSEQRVRERGAGFATTAEEKKFEHMEREKMNEKKRKIALKLDEVEMELKLEKAMKIEQSLRLLV